MRPDEVRPGPAIEGHASMGNEQGGGDEKNLDVIRQLLQKLEDAARKDGEHQQDARAPAPLPLPAPVPETSVLRPVEPPAQTRELASLQRSPSALKVAPPEPPPAPIVRHTDMEAPPEPPRRRSFVLVPVLAFLLGVATAIAAVFSIEDVRRLVQPNAAGEKVPTSDAGATTAAAPGPAPVAVVEGAKPTGTSPVDAVVASEPGLETRQAPDPAVQDQASRGAPATPARRAEPKGSLAVSSSLPQIRIALADRIAVASGLPSAFPLRFEPPVGEADGLLLVLRGVPDKTVFSKGSALGNDIWLLPAHAAHGLEVTVAEPSLRALRVEVELVALDGQIVARTATNVEVSATVEAGVEVDELKLDERAMVRLGDMLLDTGDLAGARAVLERAAKAGSAEAALRLAETFDPEQLPGSGLQPAAGDQVMARQWYQKARDLGSAVAAGRLEGRAK